MTNSNTINLNVIQISFINQLNRLLSVLMNSGKLYHILLNYSFYELPKTDYFNKQTQLSQLMLVDKMFSIDISGDQLKVL